jgi:hypothetical protein
MDRMEEIRHVYRTAVRKPLGKYRFLRPRRR